MLQQAHNRPWATGSVAFVDGSDIAEVRIPLQQANPPSTPKMKSYFWLNVVNPNKQVKLASMRVLLVDDRGKWEGLHQGLLN